MNNTLDTSSNINIKIDLEANFNAATKLSGEDYDYQTLMNFLSTGEIVEKQIAALELNEIKSMEDALVLVSNLVGQDGKVREAVAFKTNELFQCPEYKEFFIDDKIFSLFLQGIMDINGNVCRQIVEFSQNKDFGEYLYKRLPESINCILAEIEEIDKKSKQYVISKRNFQLYWCLEALYNIIESIDFESIKNIILKTGEFQDYTIREKAAKILTKLDNYEFTELKEKLQNDENYYVRRY